MTEGILSNINVERCAVNIKSPLKFYYQIPCFLTFPCADSSDLQPFKCEADLTDT